MWRHALLNHLDVMLTEQEKRLLAQAEAQVKSLSHGGLEKYLNPDARESVRQHPGRTSWAIHFYSELKKQTDHEAPLELNVLEEAYGLADAAIAYEQFGGDAFNKAAYLSNRKLAEEFTQVLQRYRLRLSDPTIKTILFKMAQELCAA